MFRRYIRHRQCDGFESLTCLLQCAVYVTLRWKTIRYINSGLSLRAGGRGFSPATNRVAPGYFYWKIEEK